MTRRTTTSQEEISRFQAVLLKAVYDRLQQIDQHLISLKGSLALQNDLIAALMANAEAHPARQAEPKSGQLAEKDIVKLKVAHLSEQKLQPLQKSCLQDEEMEEKKFADGALRQLLRSRRKGLRIDEADCRMKERNRRGVTALKNNECRMRSLADSDDRSIEDFHAAAPHHTNKYTTKECSARALRDLSFDLSPSVRHLPELPITKAVTHELDTLEDAAACFYRDMNNLVNDAFGGKEVVKTRVTQQPDVLDRSKTILQRVRNTIRENVPKPLLRLLDDDNGPELVPDTAEVDAMLDSSTLATTDDDPARLSLSHSSTKCGSDSESSLDSFISAESNIEQHTSQPTPCLPGRYIPRRLRKPALLRRKQHIIATAKNRAAGMQVEDAECAEFV
ncbi:hypothetical protein ACHAQH_002891 [Verticillium albo-atrum]